MAEAPKKRKTSKEALEDLVEFFRRLNELPYSEITVVRSQGGHSWTETIRIPKY